MKGVGGLLRGIGSALERRPASGLPRSCNLDGARLEELVYIDDPCLVCDRTDRLSPGRYCETGRYGSSLLCIDRESEWIDSREFCNSGGNKYGLFIPKSIDNWRRLCDSFSSSPCMCMFDFGRFFLFGTLPNPKSNEA